MLPRGKSTANISASMGNSTAEEYDKLQFKLQKSIQIVNSHSSENTHLLSVEVNDISYLKSDLSNDKGTAPDSSIVNPSQESMTCLKHLINNTSGSYTSSQVITTREPLNTKDQKDEGKQIPAKQFSQQLSSLAISSAQQREQGPGSDLPHKLLGDAPKPDCTVAVHQQDVLQGPTPLFASQKALSPHNLPTDYQAEGYSAKKEPPALLSESKVARTKVDAVSSCVQTEPGIDALILQAKQK